MELTRVLAIHHEDWKLYLLRAASRQKHRNLGCLEAVIREAGLGCDYHESATGLSLRSDLGRYSHVIVLGGNKSAYQDDEHPFLQEEMRLLEQVLARGIPVLGICLGAQLLARIHGARVYPAPHGPELGWQQISLTEEGRCEALLHAFPDQGLMFQWHHDTFDLPSGSVRLARSSAYENQAFRMTRQVWGFQFHLEADPTLVRAWLRVFASDQAADAQAVRGAADRHIEGSMAAARAFLRGFLGQRPSAFTPIAMPPGGFPGSAGDRGSAG
jgi:GMP synthase-like glutamine amidotransferase